MLLFSVLLAGSNYRIPGQFKTLTLTLTLTLILCGQVFYNCTYLLSYKHDDLLKLTWEQRYTGLYSYCMGGRVGGIFYGCKHANRVVCQWRTKHEKFSLCTLTFVILHQACLI